MNELTKTMVLDEEAFQKAAKEFKELSEKIAKLRSDIESLLDDLQRGFDTAAGHKFMNSCKESLLKPMDEQKIVVDHISESLNKAMNEYRSVFSKYQDLVNLLNS